MKKLHYSFSINPVCAILGPRQCGKTTLAHQYATDYAQTVHRFDLENPRHAQALKNNPMLSLENLSGLILLDEIQRVPELFPVLRYLVDHHDKRFLILGSASRDLINQSSESLAGRVYYFELTPLNLLEIPNPMNELQKHWLQGGFPKAFLSPSFGTAHDWLEAYIQTFIERDLSGLGININAGYMRSIWIALAHYHGQIINYSDIGTQIGVSHTTVKNYVDILSGTFMIRVLQPYHENLLKRQTKSPKIYIRDSGIVIHLLDISERNRIRHPKLGALWEGYALEEIIRFFQIRSEFFLAHPKWRGRVRSFF